MEAREQLILVVSAEPGIMPTRAAARVGASGSVAYGMAVIRRAERRGLVVRTRRPGAEHVGELWLPGDVPEGRRRWGQGELPFGGSQ